MSWPDEPFLNLRQTATPKGTPANGGTLLYVKSDGKLYTKNPAGVETPVETTLGDVTLNGVQTLTNKTLTSPVIDTIIGSNGLTVATFASVANAVNSIQIANNIATGAARLIAQGSDTNISINLVPKGTGTLKQNGVDVLTTTGTQTVTNKTLSTGTLVGAATTDISGAWTAYVPTYTNLTIGNATVVARYMQIGKTVHVRIDITGGTTTSATGAVSISLPVATHASGNQLLLGFYAAGASPTGIGYLSIAPSGTSGSAGYAAPALTNVTTLGNTHVFRVEGTYEAA